MENKLRNTRTPRVLRARASWLLLTVAAGACAGGAPSSEPASAAPAPGPVPATLDAEGRRWVDETLASLSLRDLVAQLVIEWIPGSYQSPSAPDFEPLRRMVEDDHIGGLTPSIGLPHSYVAKVNALQKKARIPLLVVTSPQVKPDADRLGITARIEAAGGTVLAGMCFYQSYAREMAEANGWKRLATNSAKLTNIIGGYGYRPALLSMAACVDAACAGGKLA